MKAKELREKSIEELQQLLLDQLKERFRLRIQKTAGQLNRNHLHKEVKTDIARIKTILRERRAI